MGVFRQFGTHLFYKMEINLFFQCLAIDSQHVDARISLSDLQQKAGDVELALETLRDVDFDVCSQLPDERLLIRQAEMLFQGKMTEKFIRTARLLLIPHFYDVHRAEALFSKRSLSRSGMFAPIPEICKMSCVKMFVFFSNHRSIHFERKIFLK